MAGTPQERTTDADSPRQQLLLSLQEERTGRLSAETAEGRVYDVYVMGGEILAAHSPSDDGRVLALLYNGGLLNADKIREMREYLEQGRTLSEVLIGEVPDSVLMRVYFERFRDNVYHYLHAVSIVGFVPMDAIFVDNIQVGHTSLGLVDELIAIGEAIQELSQEGEIWLRRTAFDSTTEDQRRLLARCTDESSLEDLCARSPYEYSRTLEMVLRLLAVGALEIFYPRPRSRKPANDGSGAEFDEDLAAFQDYDTVRSGGAFIAERTHLDVVDLDVETDKPVKAPPRPIDENTIIEVGEVEQGSPEQVRGAVSLNFAGPRLHEDDLRRKLEVLNEVLGVIGSVLDEIHGARFAQTRMQLLVEGTPLPFSVLFKGVEISAACQLPVSQIMRNLQKRPASEHRHLISRALPDLIERALSLADEQLSPEQLDHLLEEIAGYQQRIGN